MKTASAPSGKVAHMSAIDVPGCVVHSRTRTWKSPTLKQVLSYRNPAVVDRIAKDCKISLDEALALFIDTLRFLWLGGTFSRISPPPKVDEGWHAFLLFTMDYKKFCHRFFGGFIHHRPNRPEDKPDGGKSITRTLALVSEHLGADLSPNWHYPNLQGGNGKCDCKIRECGDCAPNK